MNECRPWSRLYKFYELDPLKRREALLQLPLELSPEDFAGLDSALPLKQADLLSENVIGTLSLPFSVAANFVVDNKSVLVPMATEEPSIVAAVSKMAKLVALSGGFHTSVDEPLIKGQLQIYAFSDIDAVVSKLAILKTELIVFLNQCCASMVARGGGVRDLSWRILSSRIGPMVIVEALIDVRDAMGANLVNTLMEALKQRLEPDIDAIFGLAILSNLCDQRLATARCFLPFYLLSTDNTHDNGAERAQKMLAAHAFAEADIYRACTHNKGVLNGIDAVSLATGNDYRAIEAGAHAYAARSGRYGPLTSLEFSQQEEGLMAQITLPLAAAVVGGNCSIHQGVQFAHKLLGEFSRTSQALASVMASVGLAQCLAALMALAHEGIQKGHMKLHHKKLAMVKK